jgi:hypothetical protein
MDNYPKFSLKVKVFKKFRFEWTRILENRPSKALLRG